MCVYVCVCVCVCTGQEARLEEVTEMCQENWFKVCDSNSVQTGGGHRGFLCV